MSIKLSNTGIDVNDISRLSISSGTNFAFSGTSAIKLPSGTTAQRPASAVEGDTRWNTDNTGLEFFNGTAWRTVGALDGSTSALAAPSAVYLKNVAGVTQNGTYWINVGGTPTQIYCNMTKNGGGWMSFASITTANWFPVDTFAYNGWAGRSYSYGTYSTSGAIGQYWRDYSAQGITEVMFMTSNGTYWISCPISYIAPNGGQASFTSGVVTSNNYTVDSYNANSTITVMFRSGQPEDPWINAGNAHANGGDASGTDYMFWGENGTGNASHGTFRVNNGGIIAFVR